MGRRIFIAGTILLCALNVATAETVINRGNDGDPATLDQHHTSNTSESALLRDLYEGLVAQGANGEVIAGVAKSWEISPDGLTYVFHLREDAKWSNGDTVTADDFLFTFQRIMNPNTAAGYANILFPIKNAKEVNSGRVPINQLGVEALDDHTLKITLWTPTTYFLELLTHQTGLPLNRKVVEKYGNKFTLPANIVTNGAYRLTSFVPNDKIVMKKNPYFWDAKNVKTDIINWFPFTDLAACMRRFEAKEMDICSSVPAEQMDYIKTNLSNEFHLSPYLGTYYIDLKGEPDSKLRDPRVRQAISLVIDRDFLSNEVMRGTMLPAYSIVPLGIGNYVQDGVKLDYADEDMLTREDKAKALLEEAGVKPGSLSVVLRYATSVNHKNVMASIADMLRKIDINASLNEVEGTTFFNYLQEKGMFDIVRDGWISDYNDPYSFLSLFTTGAYFNYAEWSNKDYDALITKSESMTDLNARAQILADAERILLHEAPVIPLLYYSSKALVADKIDGYKDNLMNSHSSRWLSVKP